MFENYYVGMVAVVVVSYLLGSIPTAYFIAKLKGVNIFEVGSGNMGATNVSRSLGTEWGVAVMALDMFKGVVAIAISRLLMPESTAAATTISAISTIIGHNWSLFASVFTGTIKGGKGASTAFGTLLMIAPVQVIVAMAVLGLVIVARTRYVSLGVLIAFTLAIIWLNILVLQKFLTVEVFHYSMVLGLLLLMRFRENIQRLLTGTERRFGDKASA
ncbi:MAG: glycerol-3-phosphate 1-O-acyltransferase PlsY [Aggregatilineales bacterium]